MVRFAAGTVQIGASGILQRYTKCVVMIGFNRMSFMKTSELLRHQIIERLSAQCVEDAAVNAVDLWEQLASKIISIIGEGGFCSLYVRSIFLAQATFPWFTDCPLSSKIDNRFAKLKLAFAVQTPERACAANCLLLITFTDILASLIGEELTTSILRSAWGDFAPGLADKDLSHE